MSDIDFNLDGEYVPPAQSMGDESRDHLIVWQIFQCMTMSVSKFEMVDDEFRIIDSGLKSSSSADKGSRSSLMEMIAVDLIGECAFIDKLN
jgi:hypothetical protein